MKPRSASLAEPLVGRFSFPSTFTLIPATLKFALAQTRPTARASLSDQILISREARPSSAVLTP